MTAFNRLPLWTFPLPDRYPIDLEGHLLRRGGAKIRLKKCVDCFTVQLARPVEDLSLWANKLGCTLDRELPAIGQIALRVEATQLEAVMARVRRLSQAGTATPIGEVAFASHVYCLSDAGLPDAQLSQSEDLSSLPLLYLTDQVALQFQPQTTAQQMEAITRAVGLEVLKLIPSVPKAFVYRLTSRAIVNPLKLANRLSYHPDVLLAEPNVALFIRDDAIASWTEDQLPTLNLRPNSTRADRSIVVAVVGRSIDLSSPAFSGMGKIVAPLDLSIFGSASPASEETDSPPSSNTLCAQIAIGEAMPSSAALSPIGQGIAPGCSLMPITIDTLLDDQAIEQVFDWGTAQGATIFCWMPQNWMPLGSLPPSLRQRAAVQRAAVQGRGGRGCVVLVQDGSGWEMPDITSVSASISASGGILPAGSSDAVEPLPAPTEAIAIGIAAGIAASALSANPNLTADRVRQILQAVQTQFGSGATSAGNPKVRRLSSNLADAVDLAVRLALQSAADGVDLTDRAKPRSLEFSDLTAKEIPDGDEQGILCTIAVESTGTIGEIEVDIAIDHAFLSDLKIWLVPPKGDAILLQDRTLGVLASLKARYGLTTTPYLRSLLGRSAQGIWTLKICDAIPGHRGALKEWHLRLGLCD